MNIKGEIIEISDTQQITTTFSKREFVIEYKENPQYPEFIKFELIQDKCGLLDAYKVGNEVNVFFNLKGRKWNDPKTGSTKFFNSLQAWKIDGNNDENQFNNDTMRNDSIDDTYWKENNDNEELPF